MRFIQTRTQFFKKPFIYRPKPAISIFVIYICLSLSLQVFAQTRSEDFLSLQKKALVFFNDKDYQNASDLYTRLLEAYPKDPGINYYSGVCLTEMGENLDLAIYRLKIASLGSVPADVYFYLGKANYSSGHFGEALNYFGRFRDLASREKQKTLKAGQWIAWTESSIADLNNDEALSSGPEIIEYNKAASGDALKNIPGRSGNDYIEQVSDAFYDQALIRNIFNPDEVQALAETDQLNEVHNKTMHQAWELDKRIEKQKVIVNAAGSKAESNRARKKIKSLEKESSRKKLEAFKGYQEINARKYFTYKSNISRILKDESHKNYKEVKRYALNSEENYRKSISLKKDAEMVTDPEEEFDLYGESNAYELLALENQKKAIAAYLGLVKPDRSEVDVSRAVTPVEEKEDRQVALKEQMPGKETKKEVKMPDPKVVIVKFPGKKETLIVEEKAIPGLSVEIKKPEEKQEIAKHEIYEFSILPTPDYNKMTPIPLDPDLPEGIVYKIQVGVFKNLRTQSYFKGLQPITAESVKERDLIRYYAGMFSHYDDARGALKKVRKNEFKDAFIVAYYKGQKIPTDKAKLIEKEGEDSQAHTLTKEQHNVYFKIQIGAYSKEVGPDIYRTFESHAGDKNLEFFVNKKDKVIYTIGNFLTFESASSFNRELKYKGLSDAFVIAFDENRKISIREARMLLNNK